jgi:hypothetical protein
MGVRGMDYYGLSPRSKELLRLKNENKDGIYTEYCPWINIYRVRAIEATENEPDDLIRGGKVALHMLSNVPVTIAPQEIFAAFGLIYHSQEEINSAKLKSQNLPWGHATRNHIALDFKSLA